MRTVLLLLTVALVGFVAINRQRLYLRDPLGTVYRSEVKVEGARVFINYSNDVLVQVGNLRRMQEFVVQGWNKSPGTPVALRCLNGMVCLAEADHVPVEAMAGAKDVVMTGRQVSFEDGDGTAVRVVLR